MLWAHAVGFSSVEFGGSLQHFVHHRLHLLQSTIIFAIPGVMFIFLLIFFWLARSLRLHISANITKELDGYNKARDRAHPTRTEKISAHRVSSTPEISLEQSKAETPEVLKHGKQWAFELWDDEAYDAEEDAIGVCISFLLVQALRLHISGRMPSIFGNETKHYKHRLNVPAQLVVCAALFIAGHILVVILKRYTQVHHWGRLVKRVVITSANICAGAFAWCLYYSAQCLEAIWLPEAPWTITELVILAFALSCLSFGFIVVLDKLADMEWNNELSRELYTVIIMSLALLVGFSWEQCFDRAVEELGAQSSRPASVKFALACGLVGMVFIPWRRHLLNNLTDFEHHDMFQS